MPRARGRLPEEAIDFLPPLRQEPALAEHRLRFVLKPSGISPGHPVGARLGFHARDPGDRLLQLRPRQARQVFEQLALVPLLRSEQRGPPLKLQEDECVHGRRQTREQFPVRSRERCGVSGQSSVELHHCFTARGALRLSLALPPSSFLLSPSQNASSASGRPSHSGILNPRIRATVGATSVVRMGRSVPAPFGTPAPIATSHTRRQDSSPLRWFAKPFPTTSPSRPSSGTTRSVVRSRYSGCVCACSTARARDDRSSGSPRGRASTRRSARCRCPRNSRPAATARAGP